MNKAVCKYFLGLLLALSSFWASAQQTTFIQGYVKKEGSNAPASGFFVFLEDTKLGTYTDKKGFYKLENIPIQTTFRLIVEGDSTHKSAIKEINIKENTFLEINFVVKARVEQLNPVEIISLKVVSLDDKTHDPDQISTNTFDPGRVKIIPTLFQQVEDLIAGGTGVAAGNALSSSFSVRGGSFDENIIYVNNVQIYRPFLVKSGQQEGLSFANPDMTGHITFYAGGWNAKYADALSSVMNLTYRRPDSLLISAYAGLLSQSAFVGTPLDSAKKAAVMVGVRRKTARYVLGNLDTQGNYLPEFFDVQACFEWDIMRKAKHNYLKIFTLSSFARNRFNFEPQTRVSNIGTFQGAIRLTVAYEGQELMAYDTYQTAFNLVRSFKKHFKVELMGSAMQTYEREFSTVEGGYRLCDVDKDPSSTNFDDCANIRGVGSIFTHSRNILQARIWSTELRTTWQKNPEWLNLEAGVRLANEQINDVLDEYTFLDSADYVSLTSKLAGSANLQSWRTTAFVQNAHFLKSDSSNGQQIHRLTFNYGLRMTHWTLNNELVFSPRMQLSWLPKRLDVEEKHRFRFNMAVGFYRQPPFYREMRDFAGNLNTDLKSQSSIQAIAGMNVLFYSGQRAFNFTSELYYKYIWNLNPYDLDNIRVRYYANDLGIGQVYGADFRISGEFIKGTNSWLNVGLLSAKEEIPNDGRGWIRGPTDQRLTVSFFVEDHLPFLDSAFKNESWKFNLRLLYGSGYPYGPPDLQQFRQAFKSGSSYKRVDIGFSKQLNYASKKKERNARAADIWLGLDIINALGVQNNLSFSWIKDFDNIYYAIPNSLQQRFYNLKLVFVY